ncbi:MAG: transglycosylase domain-containing protein [Candidatus Jorgensenbacteria bacterium]
MIKKGELLRRKRHRVKFHLSSWILLAAGAVLAGGAIFLAITVQGLPSPEQLATREVKQSTKLYDRTGTVLIYEIHGEEKRTVLPLDEIPLRVREAAIAAEDAQFYSEPAFNWKGILRALITNIKEWRFVQGGSTITQQLVKNVYLTSERTISRKVKELILSVQLESKYSKDEILFFYLNQIPYGSNAYGVEAASQTYFNKSVRDVSLAESAVLAALLRAPSYYSPWGAHVDELTTRKEYVLDRMTELGYLTADERDGAKKEKVEFSAPSLGSIKAPHFTLAVKDYLVGRYGESMVENGGLKVITSLDWDLQQLAEKAVEEGTAQNAENYGSHNAAMVVQNPKSGEVLAIVGSKDYFGAPEPEGCTPGESCQFEGNFDVAVHGLRQPGSALKPFVYLTAFQRGYTPKTTVFDVTTEFDTREDPETSYKPEDFDGKVRGAVKLEDALAQSLNIPAVKMLYLAGFDNVLKNLHAFGITTLQERWRYGLSLTLGGGEVKLIDLVNTYATLSQEGVHHAQALVLKIEDQNGNVVEEYRDQAERVADPQYPRLVTQILSDPQLRYPIFRNSNALTIFPDYEVALKTGTSEDHRDAWTVGYTPSLVVGIWTGNNDNSPMIRQGSSILAAVPVWHAFLVEALKHYQPETFTRPDPFSLSQKPMLNGESEFAPVVGGKRYPQIHSILYYIKKDDPLGTPPEDPALDSQFKNWEDGVFAWARENIPNFSEYNAPLPEGIGYETAATPQADGTVLNTQPTVVISNIKPVNGEFVNSPTVIQAEVRSAGAELQRVELYYNRRLINTVSASGNYFLYRYTIDFPLNPQNLVQIKAYDARGGRASAETLFFH